MTNTPKEFTLPKGSKVKIGDMPYLLTQDTIVSGFSEPQNLEPEISDVQVSRERPAEAGHLA